MPRHRECLLISAMSALANMLSSLLCLHTTALMCLGFDAWIVIAQGFESWRRDSNIVGSRISKLLPLYSSTWQCHNICNLSVNWGMWFFFSCQFENVVRSFLFMKFISNLLFVEAACFVKCFPPWVAAIRNRLDCESERSICTAYYAEVQIRSEIKLNQK